MRKVVLFLLGLTPFFFGGLQNWVMTKYMDVQLPYFLIGVGLLMVWFSFAFFFGGKDGKQTVLWMNLPGGVVLGLLFMQEVILCAYWRNAIGLWTQLFFLPLVNLGFRLTFWAHTVFPAYTAAFLLLIGASGLGAAARKRCRK